MARVNYAYEKRQRDLAKQKKKEEKRLKKARAAAGTAPREGEAETPVARDEQER